MHFNIKTGIKNKCRIYGMTPNKKDIRNYIDRRRKRE